MQEHILCDLRKKHIDGVQHFPEIKRLGKKDDLPSAYFFPGRRLSTEEQGGSVFEVLKVMKLVVQVQAVHVWQIVIEDEEMWCMNVNSLQGIAPSDVMRGFLLDGLNDDLSNVLLILDHKNELDRPLPGSLQVVGFPWHCISTFCTIRFPTKRGALEKIRATSKESFTLASGGTEAWYGA